jgi:predicted ATPase
MRRFILTGAPGSGKTAILRQLELQGFGVVKEAATDVIALRQSEGVAEPWTESRFVGDVTDLQMRRLNEASHGSPPVQFHDRSVVCTLALARYLAFPEPARLIDAVDRIVSERVFEKTVFLVQPLGFVTPTAARRISLEESLRFGQMHEDAYRAHGFDLVFVEPGAVADRAAAILTVVTAMRGPA